MATVRAAPLRSPASALQAYYVWLAWTVVAPILLFVFFYLRAAQIPSLSHPFASTFGTGETLIMVALLLAPLPFDVRELPPEWRDSEVFVRNAFLIVPTAAVALALLYVHLKLSAMQMLAEPQLAATQIEGLSRNSVLSLTLSGLALTYSIRLRARIYTAQVSPVPQTKRQP